MKMQFPLLQPNQTTLQKQRLGFLGLLLTICLLTSISLKVEAQEITADTYAGTWGGTYTATQGVTRVILVLEAVNNTDLKGRFIFYPDNSNPGVPSGHYLIKGNTDLASGQMEFYGTKWVIRPSNYQFAEFSGLIRLDLKSMAGNVWDENQTKIGKFLVKRLTSLPPQ